jgi:hypothetical protein
MNAITGAPLRATPNDGNAWLCIPSSKAAIAAQFGSSDRALPAATVNSDFLHDLLRDCGGA